VSDTHGLHESLGVLPDGDILIHCGDFTDKGSAEEVASFDRWLGKQPHRYKIVVAGNHDVSVLAAFDPARAAELLPSATQYLNCDIVELCGLRILGISWKQQFGAAKLLAAFMDQRSPHNAPQLDIVVAHEPPAGTLDGTRAGTLGFGCETLKELMVDGGGCAWVSLFGHVHEARGSVRLRTASGEERLLVNCAVANDGMRAHSIVAPVVILELAPGKGAAPQSESDPDLQRETGGHDNAFLPDSQMQEVAPQPEPECEDVALLASSRDQDEQPLRPLRLGPQDPPFSFNSHCLVVPNAAPAAVAEAGERLGAAIARISGVHLVTVSEGRWAQNRAFHASPVAGASATRCRTPLVLGCPAAWLAESKLLTEEEAAATDIPAVGGWVRTIEYNDSEIELESGQPPTRLMATALVAGGSSDASIVAALDWVSTEGLSRLTQSTRSIEANFPEAATFDETETETTVGISSIQGQRVQLSEEGAVGVVVKHLVEEGRLRIKLDGENSKTVWRMFDAVCVLSEEEK
jgi:predicted phosphodiesterase